MEQDDSRGPPCRAGCMVSSLQAPPAVLHSSRFDLITHTHLHYMHSSCIHGTWPASSNNCVNTRLPNLLTMWTGGQGQTSAVCARHAGGMPRHQAMLAAGANACM